MHTQHPPAPSAAASAAAAAGPDPPFSTHTFAPTSSLAITLTYPPSPPTRPPGPRPLPVFISDYPSSSISGDQTPALHRALSYASGLRHSYVALLLSKGADANARDPRTHNTALHVLAARSASAANTGVVRALLRARGVAVDAVNGAGRTPLHVAVKRGNVDVARALLVGGARADVACAAGTALHVAVKGARGGGGGGGEEMVRLLLAGGARVNARDGAGATALHVLGRRAGGGGGGACGAVARILVDAGADVNIQDGEGRSVMHVMAMAGSVEGVRLCLEREADLEMRDVGGRTAGMVDWRFAVETVRFEEERRRRRGAGGAVVGALAAEEGRDRRGAVKPVACGVSGR